MKKNSRLPFVVGTMSEQCWNNVGTMLGWGSLSLLSKVFRKKYKKGGVCPQVHPVKSRTDSADKDPKNTNMCRTLTLNTIITRARV